METFDASAGKSSSKLGILFALSTVGMAIFAGLYIQAANTHRNSPIAASSVTNTVVQFVTNDIVKEQPKEIEKIVKVPAEIPEDYLMAMNLFQRLTNASYVTMEQVLFKMKDVRTVCTLDNATRQVLSDDEVKAKFELTLRRNNVPISPNSANVIHLSVCGFFDTANQALLCYFITCNIDEQQVVLRGGECHQATVRIWMKGDSYGTVGRSKANEALLNEIEKRAEIFANDFLTSNPKEK